MSPDPYVRGPALFFLIDPLAEGADQLVAEVVTEGGYGYRLRAPIPFATEQYKAYFTHEPEASKATFDRLVEDPANDAILLELVCSTVEAEGGGAYAAAADVLLDNTDLLLALHDPSRNCPRFDRAPAGTTRRSNQALERQARRFGRPHGISPSRGILRSTIARGAPCLQVESLDPRTR